MYINWGDYYQDSSQQKQYAERLKIRWAEIFGFLKSTLT